MALERPPYVLHFLQPDEAMPTRGTADDWGETNLWKAKQPGLRFNMELGPDQLKWIERYAGNSERLMGRSACCREAAASPS